MKLIKNLTIFFPFLLAFISSCQESKKSNILLLDVQIPIDSALVFAPGIISTKSFEFALTFNPEMDELYFTRRKPKEDNKLYTTQLNDGKWSDPMEVSFSPEIGWDFEPHINPNGDKLYFGSLRPLPDSTKSSGLHQWYLEKTNNGWGKPIPLQSPIKDRFAMFLTSSENDNLYFTSKEKGAKSEDGGIYYAINQNGEYPNVKRMGDEINSIGKWIAHPYIAPDESYMIYDGDGETGFGDCDLYISFRRNGKWTKAYNLGPKINTELCEMTANVSPDGKYLFFHRGLYEDEGKVETGDIYWIDFVQLKKELMENVNSN